MSRPDGWRRIETAPTDTPVLIGGWAPDNAGMFTLGPRTTELVWREEVGLAFTLNARAIRVRKADLWARWWKSIDLDPPASDSEAQP